MGMAAAFGRLIGMSRQRKLAGEVVVDAAFKIADTYCELLESGEGRFAFNENLLPYTKENIKTALQVLYVSNTDVSYRESNRATFLGLATFQPLTDEEDAAVAKFAQLTANATDVVATGPSILNVMGRVNAEIALLKGELSSRGMDAR